MKKAAATITKINKNPEGRRAMRNQFKIDTIREESEAQDKVTSLLHQIESSTFFKTRSKHHKIVLESWVEMLKRNEYGAIWKNNKLTYLKLLHLMCHCEFLLPPFTTFPAQQGLPLLHRHQADRIIDHLEKQVRNSKLTTKRQVQATSKYPQGQGKIRKDHQRENESCQSRKYQRIAYEGKQNTMKKVEASEMFEGYESTQKKKSQNITSNHIINPQYKEQSIRAFNGERKPSESFKNSHKFTSSFNTSDHVHQYNFDHGKDEPKVSISYSPKRKNHNSISESVSLELSPVSVSSKVWELTHRKTKQMGDSFELSKLTKINQQKREKCGNTHNLSNSRGQYSTGELLKLPNKQYWESDTFTGNITPKYLDSFKPNFNMILAQSQQIQTVREEKICCECSYEFWYKLM